jgi:hypothetical protein
MNTIPCPARITFTPDSALIAEAPEIRWQLASVIIPLQTSIRFDLSPGQVAIAAAAAEESAEVLTREAESCKVCADWAGLCASCMRLSRQAVGYRGLADQLREAGRR